MRWPKRLVVVRFSDGLQAFDAKTFGCKHGSDRREYRLVLPRSRNRKAKKRGGEVTGMTPRLRKLRRNRRRAGLCLCGRKRVPGFKLCQRCRAYNQAYFAAAKKPRRANGKQAFDCGRCGKSGHSRRTCPENGKT
jgi:hypothetical protein